tara:strand:+ start:4830 stop:5066 length:237 start_codon:yes stop_codon:yes gene_type:complete
MMKTTSNNKSTEDSPTTVPQKTTTQPKKKKKKCKKKKKKSYQAMLDEIIKPKTLNEDKYKDKILQCTGGGNHQKVLLI